MEKTRPPQKHDGHLGGVRGVRTHQPHGAPIRVTVTKPGHPDRFIEVRQLAPWLQIVVDRLCVTDSMASWRDLPTSDRGIFIETYELTAVSPPRAEFRSLRRAHGLARHFDPARLPA